MSSNGPLTIVTALPCHGISKPFQSSQNLVEFTFIIYGICIRQDVCTDSGVWSLYHRDNFCFGSAALLPKMNYFLERQRGKSCQVFISSC